MKIGSIALIPIERGLFQGLKCSKGRGYILPGGKHEPGETFSQTAIRETKEETGIVVEGPRFLFCGPHTDGFMVYTFVCYKRDVMQVAKPSREGEPVFCTWQMLLRSEFGPYYEIIKQLYERR